MKIGKRATLAEIDAAAWTAFARDAGLGLPLIRRRVGELCGRTQSAALAVAAALSQPGLDEAALETLAHAIGERARHCAVTVSR